METYGVTAKRVAIGSNAVVKVTFPCGRVETLGGKRAERATAVVIAAYGRYENFDPIVHYYQDGSRPLGVVGLRANAVKAAKEAACLLAPKPGRDKFGHKYPANRAASLATAVPIEG
jgi:hypothetical protein